ncbi:MAG: hypothetical protein BA862_10485 [Desulfobulbaceae bacterium S3730MH12]|nr:MAG: hypothetical protein BA862_10485 [Desulfobulbaceae bacterium S3730MH12]
MAFKKLVSHNKSEYVYAQIIKEIKSGQYGLGDKLPSEMEIADQAGVSRASVREALSALRLIGVIETKKGNGTYVKSNKFAFETEDAAIFDHGANTFEILEARKVVEPVIAKLALEMIDKQHLEQIKVAIEAMEAEAGKNDFDSYHQANKRFHNAIAEATRNRSLINYVRSLQTVFIDSDFGAELRRRYLTEKAYVKDAIATHWEIYEAFVAGDEKLLDEAWKRHNEGVEKQLLGH